MWKLAIFVSVLLVVHAQDRKPPVGGGGGGSEDRPDRERPGGDGPGPGQGDRPRPECTVDSLPEDLEENVKTILTSVLGEGDIATIIPVLDKIPVLCINALKEKIEAFTGITKEQAIEALCQAGGDKIKMRPFMELVEEVEGLEVCDVLDGLLEKETGCEDAQEPLQKYKVEECGFDGLTTADILELDPEAIKEYVESLDQEKKKAFGAEVMAAIKADPEILVGLPCHAKKVLIGFMEKLMTANGMDLESMVQLDSFWEDYAIYLPYMSEDVCEKIQFQQILTRKDFLKDLDFMCQPPEMMEEGQSQGQGQGRGRGRPQERPDMCMWQCGRELIKTALAGKETATDDEKAQIDSLESLLKCQMLKDLEEQAKPGECGSVSADVIRSAGDGAPGRAMRDLAQRCRPQKPPGQMTKDDLKDMGCTAAAFSGLRDIPKEELCDKDFLKDTLAPCLDVIPENREVVMEVCGGDLSDEDLAAMGEAAVFADPGRLRGLGRNMDREKARQLANGLREMPEGRKKAAAFQLALEAPPKELMGDADLAKAVPLKRFKEAIKNTKVADFIKDADLDGLPQAPKRELLRKHLSEAGKSDMKKLKPEDIAAMDKLAEGLSPRDLRGFDPIRKKEILQEICKLDGFIGKQSEAIGEELKDALEDIDAEKPLDVLSEDDIANMQGDCLALLCDEGLRNASMMVRQAVCQRVGEQPRLKCMLNRNRRGRCANICAMNEEETDEESDDDMEDTDAIDAAGSLLADVDPEMIEDLDGEEVLEKLDRFHPPLCLRKNIREKIIKKLQEKFGVEDLKKPEILAKLKDYAFAIHKDKRDQFKEELVTYGSIDDVTVADEDSDVGRNLRCCLGEMSEADRAAAEEFDDAVKEAQFEVIEDTTTDDGSSVSGDAGAGAGGAGGAGDGKKRRRKRTRFTREATALTCQDVMDMSSQSLLEVSHVEEMSATEFQNCIATFGSGNQKMETRKAIVDRIRTEIGSGKMCDLPAATLTDLGALAQALTPEDIECLKNFAGVSGLGGYSGYSDDQLMKFAQKYLSANNKASASAMTASDVGNMGHFVCGLTKDEITSIKAEVFADSSSVIGQLKVCRREALEAWAVHAVAEFGPVKDWDHGHFAEAGIMLGGLSSAQLADADVDDVTGWSPAGLQHLHPDTLNELDIEMLQQLSRYQAQSLTPEQLEELDLEARNAINYAKDGFDGSTAEEEKEGDKTTDGGGCGNVSVSILTLLSVFSIGLLLQ